MCVVSMVSREWIDSRPPWTIPPGDLIPGKVIPWTDPWIPHPSSREFEKLKREVEELKKELEKARAQDIAEQAPDCKDDEKVELLKRIADAVGVDLSKVFEGHK